MYFWDTVYGRLPCFGDSPSDTVHAEEAAGFLGMMENNEEEEEEQENQLGNRTSDEPTPEEIKAEVTKWVKRSSIGSAIAVIVFVSWTISFHLNQDNFGPKWFVMSQDDEDGLVGEVLIFIFSGGGSCGLELRLEDFESYDHQGNTAIAEAGSLAMF
eukprot:CAMPEP_0198251314 /NCGR_PEP_ID=MMETSP1447-20131203/2181_1 /TAXON_ID=420782 /ORGANISM="Chaetoceros dichaeta, Strain CCMP1751" /LENGTH=156 /DNA_ID=CAMNT_0043936295 /DNA_START=154 /DNA_END=625 /DNA_ORIENTATION=+